MRLSKNEIAIRKLSAIIVEDADGVEPNQEAYSLAATLNAEMIGLGFIMSKELFDELQLTGCNDIVCYALELIEILKKLKGDDVKYEPMYPNFPQQVMEASDIELFMNAIIHYWSFGQLLPDYVKEHREFALENVKLREIGLTTEEKFQGVFTSILSSNDSISKLDKSIMDYFIKNYRADELRYPSVIPFKENMCWIAGTMVDKNRDIRNMIKTPTDILRVLTYMSGGDISLATNTKFKSLPRRQRRYFAGLINDVINEEDIQRHRNKWNKLFHNLHINEYASEYTKKIVGKVRNNKRLITTAGTVQELINKKEYVLAAQKLMTRPGEFARKLDYLLRTEPDTLGQMVIADSFTRVIPKISTRVMLQLYGHLLGRHKANMLQKSLKKRVIFPKGNTQKAQIIPALPWNINRKIYESILNDILNQLSRDRFSKLEPLGKVYIDDMLKECPLPAQQRSASTALDIYARGTRIPVGSDKDTIRLFIYWIGEDIDLSATFHNEHFERTAQVSYTNLRESKIKVYHSGDIIEAPHGAVEFIDIDIPSALAAGHRYVVMNVYVYTGPDFKDHKKVYAGWMTRKHPKSNEIFEPATVENKFDLEMESRTAVPVIFDLKERKVIIADLIMTMNTHYGGNNVHSNKASIANILEAMLSLDNKTTLYDLFKMHALGRGEIVENREDADFVFALDGDITPRSINIINSEYIT